MDRNIDFDKFLDRLASIPRLSELTIKVFVQWPRESTTIEINMGSLKDLDGIQYWYVSRTFDRESTYPSRWPIKKNVRRVFLDSLDIDWRNGRLVFRILEKNE